MSGPEPRYLPPYCQECKTQHMPGEHKPVPMCAVCHERHWRNQPHIGNPQDWSREDGEGGLHESIAPVSAATTTRKQVRKSQ